MRILTILVSVFFTAFILFFTQGMAEAKIPTKLKVNYHQLSPEAKEQVDCLAHNIYFEAASEPFEGKVAVAQVTINRSESGKYPSDICGVVYQKNVVYGRVICQFSWYCESGPTIRHNGAYKESMEVAKKVLLEDFRLSSLKHAYFYHADYVNPNWKLPKITKIGRHIFYGQRV